MPEPIPFREANFTFTAPVNKPEVMELPVFRDQEQVISCWRFTKPELEEIMRTGVVWLSILTQGSMPPVAVLSEYPFVKKDPNADH